MDVSSEMIHALLPVFLVTGLGASALVVGLIDGAAEALALVVKVFSGALSDAMGRRKPLAVLGYGLGALSKPLFALAGAPGWVLGARLMDRLGKGIRGAPRDALVADITPPAQRGAAFGLRQSLDTVGAFLGPMLAIGLMLLWANDFRAVFAVAVIPALLSVAVLVLGVKEPEAPAGPTRTPPKPPWNRERLAQLPAAYWWVVGLGAVFTLARFSEAFLVLRLQQGGLGLAWTPMVLVAMNVVYALGAYPLGWLADKVSHARLLLLGLVLLVAADVALAHSGSGPFAWAGILLWGAHLAATQGLLAAMVADTAPPDLRGTAYGLFNLASGLAMLVASVLAGWLWDRHGASATFIAGAVLASAACLGVLWRQRAAAR
ncbi:MAG: MFS transporter [Ideonella sp.]|nr:MFS transporter [Ideonella sp.]MBL0150297.1 MFS transporter [Ideonella sp.]